MAEADETLTVKDAAGRMRVTTYTIQKWCRTGKLRGVKVGRLWRIPQREVERVLREGLPDDP